MKSSYKLLGNYISEVDNRDTAKKVELLLGVSIQKKFMPSIANIIGTDMSTYKIVKKNQFAYGPVTSRNGDKISIALLQEANEAIISQAYVPFEVIDYKKLNPEYLMMWFRRPEFDRYARFKSHGSAREIFSWEDMCNVELPIPHPNKQRQIVKDYNTIVNRIVLNNQLIQKLEETAQAIYQQWFVDFEFPDKDGKPYKSSGGAMTFNMQFGSEIPQDWHVSALEELIEDTVGGDWGESHPNGNYSAEVLCIRGTDIPNYQIGQLGNSPKRYILPLNLDNKNLHAGQLVIEISGGSPTQSTGRTVLILEEHLKFSKGPIICSNFCKALTLKNALYAGFVYSFVNLLYSKNILFNFENSTIGLKNFDLSGFLSQQVIINPPKDIISKYNVIYYKLLKTIFNYGRQNELLSNNHDMIMSNLILSSK